MNNYFNSLFYQSLIDAFKDKEKAELVAWRIACDLGGQKIYIPHHIKPTHKLAKYGQEAIEYLSYGYGGDTITIPKGPFTNHRQLDQQAKELVSKGYSANSIARLLNIHHRTAQLKQKKYKNINQLSFF